MLPKAYPAGKIEDEMYTAWEASGFFDPDNLIKLKTTFSIAMPPPNATGELHIGHAMFLTLQDIMIRYHRMKGEATVWLPGTDHASIATQNKVEKDLLKKEGKTRHDLGRAEFLKRVNQFVESSQHTIRRQIRKMGASCDWSRERYTLDKGLTRAVQEVFVRMYRDGLIYRGDRIVNWCPRCASTLADDEVEYKTVKGKFYYFRYGPIVIGTARPETKFLDKTIVVHPKDKRYKHLIGYTFMVPWIEGDVEAAVISDECVEMEMGSGAMTLTPAHSFVDFDLAQKHHLPIVHIIDEKGNLTDAAGEFAGQNARTAREAIVAKMRAEGLVLRIDEKYEHNLSVCYRCDTPVEPLVSRQWFINVSSNLKVQSSKLRKVIRKNEASLKETAIAVVKKGEIKIIPDRFNKTYFHWMENLRDWCISRQIWFGHRIPVWYCCGKVKSQKSKVKTTTKNLKLNNTFLFLRHAETIQDKNISVKKWKLSEVGEGQIQELILSSKLNGVDVIISSPLPRAFETARIIGKALSKKVIQMEEFSELDRGAAAFIPEPEFTRRIARIFSDLEYTADEWEKGQDAVKRFERGVSLLDREYKNKKILIVSHGLILSLFDGYQNGNTKKAYQEWKNLPFSNLITLDNNETTQQCNNIVVSIEKPKQCPKCGGKKFVQDPDTLDTWFSSGLWTFSTLGWPEKTKDLKRFHPTTVMETGYDILFFWVARMILMSTYALGEVPFKTVYLHGLVRDKLGRKMSKSLDNGIDPLDMIKKFGADAVRLSLVIGTTPGNDIRLYEEKIAGYRNFVNKIWNIARYIILNSKIKSQNAKLQLKIKNFTLPDHWIVWEMRELIKRVNKNLESFRFSAAGEDIYEFMWHKLADVYIEETKREKVSHQQAILEYVLEKCLVMLHPFVPFVTEYVFQKFKIKNQKSEMSNSLLMVQPWVDKIDFKISKTKASEFIKARETKKQPALSAHERQELKKYIVSLEARLKNKEFLSNAPREVIEKEKTRLKLARENLIGAQ